MCDLPIAYGNSCYAKTWSNKTIRFDTLCDRLSTTIRTSETAEEYPKLAKADRDWAKGKGGFVGGQLRDNRRKRENVACRSILTEDVDHVDADFIQRFTDGCRYAACLYTTHGHTPEAPRVRFMPRSKVLENSVMNEILILTNDPDCANFAFNEMANRVQVTGEVPWTRPRDNPFWRDADTAQLKALIDARYVWDKNRRFASTGF